MREVHFVMSMVLHPLRSLTLLELHTPIITCITAPDICCGVSHERVEKQIEFHIYPIKEWATHLMTIDN